MLDLTGIATVLADQLMLAQQSAAAFRAADTRSRAALYRALGRAYDFAHATAADPTGFADLLNRSGLVAQARAPALPEPALGARDAAEDAAPGARGAGVRCHQRKRA